MMEAHQKTKNSGIRSEKPIDLLIAVEITEREARIWRFMLESGVFEMTGGNVILSFDRAGELKTIKRELFSYAGDKALA